jgi:hypothetical protein
MIKSLLGSLLMRLLPMLMDWLVAYLKEQQRKAEQRRRADDLNNSKDEDEFDRSSDSLP